ncbi:MmyB family transcriptional regulator [Streptomyces sp. 7N604]|uniref:MmyB family transcriptional regulator n=1 Tax=Streptomyces sp. 7N604 TaxID=3457415 RepID=UPI003FD68D31
MLSASLGEVLAVYRIRAGLEPALVAQRAGLSEDRYRALELGTGWPGAAALRSVIDALEIPEAERARFELAEAPIDEYLQRMLHGYNIPALIVDSSWRTMAANFFAIDLLPGSDTPGWSLMRWILLDDDAKKRLANWDNTARVFAAALREALAAAPADSELIAIRAAVDPALYTSAPADLDCPDGRALIWRTPAGPYHVSACLVTVPGGRPDLRQITIVPRTAEPVLMEEPSGHEVIWHGSVLADLARCGICHSALIGGLLTDYRCVHGCLPDIPPPELELRIAREALPRIFTPEAIRQLAAAQEILTAGEAELALNVPVTAQHAVHQWQHSMTPARRRGMLMLALASVAVSPAGGQRVGPRAVHLAYAWRNLS